MSEIKRTNGWGFPVGSKKAHYFVDDLSLCNRWLFTGLLEQGNDDSPDNCIACVKRLKAIKKKKARARKNG